MSCRLTDSEVQSTDVMDIIDKNPAILYDKKNLHFLILQTDSNDDKAKKVVIFQDFLERRLQEKLQYFFESDDIQGYTSLRKGYEKFLPEQRQGLGKYQTVLKKLIGQIAKQSDNAQAEDTITFSLPDSNKKTTVSLNKIFAFLKHVEVSV